MRKHTSTLAVLLMLLTGCTSEIADTLPGDATTTPAHDNQLAGSLPAVKCDDSPSTRSSLVYDDHKHILKFSWDMGDKIGVLWLSAPETPAPETPASESETPVSDGQVSGDQVAGKTQVLYQAYQLMSDHLARFKKCDEKITTKINKGETYVAYCPAKETDASPTAIPISFDNQVQKNSVNMYQYYKSEAHADDPEYLATEKQASAHLSDYDYCIAKATADPDIDDKISFDFSRVCAPVRFYLRIPEPLIYDELQVVNKDADFILDATLDATNPDLLEDKSNSDNYEYAKSAITPKRTRHIVSLKLQEPDKTTAAEGTPVTYKDGIDLTNKEDKYYWVPQEAGSDPAYKGYLIAYMMFAPINLKDLDDNSILYLIGHEGKGNTKRYFKAKGGLSKIRIRRDLLQQWAPKENTFDEPIEFEPVEVEIWNDDTTFENQGAGTEGW